MLCVRFTSRPSQSQTPEQILRYCYASIREWSSTKLRVLDKPLSVSARSPPRPPINISLITVEIPDIFRRKVPNFINIICPHARTLLFCFSSGRERAWSKCLSNSVFPISRFDVPHIVIELWTSTRLKCGNQSVKMRVPTWKREKNRKWLLPFFGLNESSFLELRRVARIFR